VGADVNGLAYRLRRPTDYGWQAWEESPLTGAVESHHAVVGGTVWEQLFEGTKPPGSKTWHGVDYPSLYWTESLVEKPAFNWAYLSSVRDIMVIMCVPLVEQLYQTAMGRIPALKCLFSGARGRLHLHAMMSGI
jgi:hypothetical protein